MSRTTPQLSSQERYDSLSISRKRLIAEFLLLTEECDTIRGLSSPVDSDIASSDRLKTALFTIPRIGQRVESSSNSNRKLTPIPARLGKVDQGDRLYSPTDDMTPPFPDSYVDECENSSLRIGLSSSQYGSKKSSCRNNSQRSYLTMKEEEVLSCDSDGFVSDSAFSVHIDTPKPSSHLQSSTSWKSIPEVVGGINVREMASFLERTDSFIRRLEPGVSSGARPLNEVRGNPVKTRQLNERWSVNSSVSGDQGENSHRTSRRAENV